MHACPRRIPGSAQHPPHTNHHARASPLLFRSRLTPNKNEMAPPPPAPAALSTGAATDDEKASAVAIFRQSWEVYTKVVEHDYMSHVLLFDALSKDMAAAARKEEEEGEPAGRLSLVDLGCGGADALAAALLRAPDLARRVGAYTGVDLSDIALAHARANLLGGPVQGGFPDVRSSSSAAAAAAPGGAGALRPGCDARFVEQDMVSFAESLPEGSTDVILAAFALHHLTPDQKNAVIRAAARALKPEGGAFYYLDVWMRDDPDSETRETYLARYRALLDSWGLTEREAKFIWDHVSAYDFPARQAEVLSTPFFAKAEVVARDGGPHALVRLTGPRRDVAAAPEGAQR